MKVVLFNPRAQRAHRRLPLSVLHVSRGIPEGHDVHLVDGNVERNAVERLRTLCGQGRVLLLMTVMPGPQLRVAVPLTRALKAANPALVVVWGGTLPRCIPRWWRPSLRWTPRF